MRQNKTLMFSIPSLQSHSAVVFTHPDAESQGGDLLLLILSEHECNHLSAGCSAVCCSFAIF